MRPTTFIAGIAALLLATGTAHAQDSSRIDKEIQERSRQLGEGIAHDYEMFLLEQKMRKEMDEKIRRLQCDMDRKAGRDLSTKCILQ
jgi:hypothetical protein